MTCLGVNCGLLQIRRRLEVVIHLGLQNVIAHGSTGGLGIASTYRTKDALVHVGSNPQGIGLPHSLAPQFIVHGGDHSGHGSQDGVARGIGHSSVELEIMNKKCLRVIDRCIETDDLLRHTGQLFAGGTFGRHGRNGGLQNPSRLEDLVLGKSMQRCQYLKSLAIERRW